MADQCISKMLDNHWYQSKQPEWTGLWLEYYFACQWYWKYN
ncbi:hypothetical protein [Mycoplasmopsis canis]|nr:hypothetical protein [Mycoplasmopsis canis]